MLKEKSFRGMVTASDLFWGADTPSRGDGQTATAFSACKRREDKAVRNGRLGRNTRLRWRWAAAERKKGRSMGSAVAQRGKGGKRGGCRNDQNEAARLRIKKGRTGAVRESKAEMRPLSGSRPRSYPETVL